MGWEHLRSSLYGWFAEAWARGLVGAACDLAWVLSMLEHPRVAVDPGLRALLDVADEGAQRPSPPDALASHLVESIANELRDVVAKNARLEENRVAYRRRHRGVVLRT